MRHHRSMLTAGCLLLATLTAASLGLGAQERPAAPKGDGAAQPAAKREDARPAASVAANVAGFVGDPYPLDTCPVAGEKLGADAVTVVLKGQKDPLQDGRQLKFCCKECVAKFEANPTEYVAKLDAAIVKKEEASYPVETCLLMQKEKLDGDAKSVVFGNRLYKFCCKKCAVNFQKNPARAAAAYEKAVVEKQAATYPLDTCVVAGEKLEAGKQYEFVVGSHLVRTCCKDCAKKVLENPTAYVAKIDEAKAKAKAPAGAK